MVKVYTDCPVEYTASILSNKWKCLIMRNLITGKKRFNELNKSIIGISAKALTENLRELEKDGIVIRKTYAVVPPKVEYYLSSKGKDLIPIINLMKDYGNKYKEE